MSGASPLAQYEVFFSRIEDPNNLPTVMHCSAGKDRTGWASAAVLTALGVPKATVMQDYLASNEYLQAKNEKTMTQTAALIDRSLIEPVLTVKQEYLDASFSEVAAKYKIFDKYLAAVGVTKADRQQLQEELLGDELGDGESTDELGVLGQLVVVAHHLEHHLGRFFEQRGRVVEHEAQADEPEPARHGRRDDRVHEHARRRAARVRASPPTPRRADRSGMVMIALSAGFTGTPRSVSRPTNRSTLARSRCGMSGVVLAGCAAPPARRRVEPGVLDAVKISGSESRVSSSMASAEPIERAAARTERLRERDRDQVDVGDHTVVLGRAAPALAEHAQAVRLVVEQERVGVLAAQRRPSSASGAVSPPIE